MRCNNCNEEIKEFGCDYNADISNYYEYNEEENKFVLVNQDINNDNDTNFHCIKCGATFSDEIINKLNF